VASDQRGAHFFAPTNTRRMPGASMEASVLSEGRNMAREMETRGLQRSTADECSLTFDGGVGVVPPQHGDARVDDALR